MRGGERSVLGMSDDDLFGFICPLLDLEDGIPSLEGDMRSFEDDILSSQLPRCIDMFQVLD